MADADGYAARSDVGRVREGNEDRYLARPPVFAVADGMGGHQAGEVASELAMSVLGESLDQDPSLDGEAIAWAMEEANRVIRGEARRRPELVGMGTTCTVAVVGLEIRIAHVGDSRAYRLREHVLEQLTEDHSLVARMVREGFIDSDAASTERLRHVITRALGATDGIEVDVVTADRAPGDRLLLCSDGLHGQVDDAAIARVLSEEPDPAKAADRLVELANDSGGDDNVTVVVIVVDRVAPVPGVAAGSAAPVGPPPDATGRPSVRRARGPSR
jgi:protein phosphatase